MDRKDLRIDLLTVWENPDHYYGFSPDEDYLIYSRTRDSSILEDNNYEQILEELRSIDNNNAYDFRANHFLCGWVEHILIKKDSPNKLLEKAIDIIAGLFDYPVYNEESYSEKQDEAINEYWNDLSLKEKVELCKKHNVSIFAARDNKEKNVYNISNDIYYKIEEYVNE